MIQAPQSAYPMYPNMMQTAPPPASDFQAAPWTTSVPPPTAMTLPPEPQPISAAPSGIDEDKQKREGTWLMIRHRFEQCLHRNPFNFTAAVALEKQNQRATLLKQREDYKKRATALRRELKTLKDQREELASGSEPPSPTTNGFLKENDKLQVIFGSDKNGLSSIVFFVYGNPISIG